MKILVDADKLRGLGTALLMDTIEARATDLEVGDTDSVFVGHPEREVAGGFAQERVVAQTVLHIEVADGNEPVKIFRRVLHILVVGSLGRTVKQDVVRRRRKVALDPFPASQRNRCGWLRGIVGNWHGSLEAR